MSGSCSKRPGGEQRLCSSRRKERACYCCWASDIVHTAVTAEQKVRCYAFGSKIASVFQYLFESIESDQPGYFPRWHIFCEDATDVPGMLKWGNLPHGPTAFNRLSGSTSMMDGIWTFNVYHPCRQGGLELRLLCHICKLGVQCMDLGFIGSCLGQLLFLSSIFPAVLLICPVVRTFLSRWWVMLRVCCSMPCGFVPLAAGVSHMQYVTSVQIFCKLMCLNAVGFITYPGVVLLFVSIGFEIVCPWFFVLRWFSVLFLQIL